MYYEPEAFNFIFLPGAELPDKKVSFGRKKESLGKQPISF